MLKSLVHGHMYQTNFYQKFIQHLLYTDETYNLCHDDGVSLDWFASTQLKNETVYVRKAVILLLTIESVSTTKYHNL